MIAPNELLAAARMSVGILPTSDVRIILEAIRETPSTRDRTALETFSADALRASKQWKSDTPYDDGYTLAQWLRQRMGLEGRIEPEEILATLGVRVRELALSCAQVDAVSCWGPRHGPAVLVNTEGRHAQSRGGRRASAAHEICHLLVDRRGALPLAEVLGGQAPRKVEARARAFAAELLLPRRIAGQRLAAAVDPADELQEITVQYGVSGEVAAWQARNSDSLIPAPVLTYLKAQVSSPERF